MEYMKTTSNEHVFLRHQCTRRKSQCYNRFLFQRYLSFLYPQKKAHCQIDYILPHPPHSRLRQIIFFHNNKVLLLIFRIKYVKHMCHSCSENSRIIFMTHISQVNNCELIIIHLNIL
jgi:hypothetical protein